MKFVITVIWLGGTRSGRPPQAKKPIPITGGARVDNPRTISVRVYPCFI